MNRGIPNLLRHVNNIINVYGLPAVVAFNAFATDTEKELNLVKEKCEELGVKVILSRVWERGGEGGIELAEEVIRLCEADKNFAYAYEDQDSLEDKIKKLTKKIYGGKGIVIEPKAQKEIEKLETLGFGKLPVCMAKTQYSFSDDPNLKGAPEGFTIRVKSLRVSAGAGFIVVLTGDIMTMPGLPKKPAAEKIQVTKEGRISGLF